MNRTARRDPELTRQQILEAAFNEIHEQGFRAASLDDILAKTGLTKGALYHHFPNKQALGYAVLEEVIIPMAAQEWSKLTDESLNPIDALSEILRAEMNHSDDKTRMGCPVNNLVQEMSGIDEGFRVRLMNFQRKWVQVIEDALARGQARGQVRPEFNAHQVAILLVAGFEGCTGMAKCNQDPESFGTCINAMVGFLSTLRG